MKKLVTGLLVLNSITSFAQSMNFQGEWISKDVALTINQKEFSSCQSIVSIDINNKQFVIASPVLFSCSGYTYFIDTLPLDILDDGVLYNSRTRARGTITNNRVEFFSPILCSDGSLTESHTIIELSAENVMQTNLKLECSDYALHLSGHYSRP